MPTSKLLSPIRVLFSMFAIVVTNSALATAYHMCQQGQILLWHGGGVDPSTGAPAGSNCDPAHPMPADTTYLDPSAWSADVDKYCDGSAYPQFVKWEPVRPCDATDGGSAIGDACKDATVVATYWKPDAGLLPHCFDDVQSSDCAEKDGKPVQASSGTEMFGETDYVAPQGLLNLTRNYSSRGAISFLTLAPGMLGNRWRTNFDKRMYLVNTTTTQVIAVRPDSRVEYFDYSGNETTHFGDTATATVTVLSGGGFKYSSANDELETYDSSGRLTQVIDRNSQLVDLAYDTAGRLSAVSDSYGRALGFAYSAGYDSYKSGTVTVSDNLGVVATYHVDAPGVLTSVDWPGGASKIYSYDAPKLRGYLTKITDENGADYGHVEYYIDGRVEHSNFANALASGSIGRYSYVYNSAGTTTVTSPLGEVSTRAYTNINGVLHQTSSTEPCASCGSITQSSTYDSIGYVATKTDFRGNVDTFNYDPVRGLQTSRIEASNDASTNSAKRTIQADWSTTFRLPVERRILNASGVVEGKTKWKYNTRGQVVARCEVDPADATASAYTCLETGALPAKVRRWVTEYCESADVGATNSTCPILGLRKTSNGPRPASDTGMALGQDDVTTYTYYPTTDETSCTSGTGTCHRKGDLWKVTNALGHVTEYLTYDKAGRVTRSQDANGTATFFTYNARGWLLMQTVRLNANPVASSTGDSITTLTYDVAGNLTRVTQPDGVFLNYTYDAAHRLTDIVDNLGSRIHYTLDPAGNRKNEETFDASYNPTVPGQGLKRALTREFNQLNHLKKVKDGNNQVTLDSTSFGTGGLTDGYDSNGNVTHTKDGLNVETLQQYDPLNRLVSTIQDYVGTNVSTQAATTQFGYDVRDNLRSVVDPSGLTTSYDVDGLNDLVGLHSPDTGVTSYGYDAAGNRVSQTDARSVTATYRYDAINRIVGINYPTSSLNITFDYDVATGCSTGTFSIGHLSAIHDHSGSTSYCYDRRGNVVEKHQSVVGALNTVALNTRYEYSTADRLTAIVYPSGTRIIYGRDGAGRVATIDYEAADVPDSKGLDVRRLGRLVESVTYYPFGPVRTISFGNGRTLTKAYDQNYQIAGITSSDSYGLNLGFLTDVMGDITDASDLSASGSESRHYSYDSLYRMSEMDDATSAPKERFGYNKTGDRTAYTLGTQSPQVYTYLSNTHRLGSIAGASRSYDAVGNTTATPAVPSFTYDDRNRMAHATPTAWTSALTFDYNGRGERVYKGLGANDIGATAFAYDEAGKLLNETQFGEALRAEYFYLDSTPVAVSHFEVLCNNPGAHYRCAVVPNFHYLETDYLGTPRVVGTEDNPGAIPEWKWDFIGSAFGDHAADEDPDGDSILFAMNLRFSGQQYDSETGLHYNNFRDYDPSVGRYVESDPLGVDSGVSTYSYIRSSPLAGIDPLGLRTICVRMVDPALNPNCYYFPDPPSRHYPPIYPKPKPRPTFVTCLDNCGTSISPPPVTQALLGIGGGTTFGPKYFPTSCATAARVQAIAEATTVAAYSIALACFMECGSDPRQLSNGPRHIWPDSWYPTSSPEPPPTDYYPD